jgi:hypothetical protein
MEAVIQEITSATGRCVTEEVLKCFDMDGVVIRIGEIKLTARERDPKEYQILYGPLRSSAMSIKAPGVGASTARLSIKPGSCLG